MLDASGVQLRVRRERLKERLLGRRDESVYLGRFELRELLGAGGMGSVYAAHDPELDRTVAIKLLDEALPPEQLHEEARTLARLSHPNVVPVHEIGWHDGRAFVVMERIDGESLAQWLRREQRPWTTVLRAFVAAGRGLAAAHALDVVHRDFKPDNVLIDGSEHVRVADFGLALRTDATMRPEEGAHLGVEGTPTYLAPELVAGEPADARSDQFAYCVSALAALFGSEAAVRSPPPRRVRRILERGRAADPSQRWPSMDALLEPLERTLAPTLGWRAWALGLGALAVGAIAFVWREPPLDPCRAGVEAVARAWPESTRTAVAAREPGGDVPSLVAGLDAYAERWRSTHESVCRAPSGARAEVCLQSRLRTFARVAQSLAEDERPPGRQLAAVLSLPTVEDCAEQADTPGTSLDLTLELALADAIATSIVDVSDQTLADFEAIIQRARDGAFDLSLTHALLEDGTVRMFLGDQLQAAPRFEEAFWIALERGHHAEASRAAAWLAFVHGVSLRDHEHGALWARLAETTARHPGVPASIHADAIVKRALVLKQAGQLAEAVEAYDRAMEVFERVPSPSPLAVVEYADRRSSALLEVGRADEALPQVVEAVEYARVTFGRRHPNVAHILSTHGAALQAMQRHTEAVEVFREALEIYELRHNRRGRAGGRLSLAHALQAAGRSEEALPLAEEGVRQEQENRGPDSPYVGSGRVVLAEILLAVGRPEAALEEIERAMAILEEHLGPAHPDLLDAHVVRSRVYAHAGWPDEAWAALQQAQTVAEALPEPRRTTVRDQLARARQSQEGGT